MQPGRKSQWIENGKALVIIKIPPDAKGPIVIVLISDDTHDCYRHVWTGQHHVDVRRAKFSTVRLDGSERVLHRRRSTVRGRVIAHEIIPVHGEREGRGDGVEQLPRSIDLGDKRPDNGIRRLGWLQESSQSRSTEKNLTVYATVYLQSN